MEAMQKWSDPESSPFFQQGKGHSNTLRYHHPFVIPPAHKSSTFDEKMRMITVNRHHYFIPDKNETAVSTFSRVKNAKDAPASEILSRSHFLESLDPNQTW